MADTTIQKYDIITADSIKTLRELIRMKIDSGWQPFHGIIKEKNHIGVCCWHQVIIQGGKKPLPPE